MTRRNGRYCVYDKYWGVVPGSGSGPEEMGPVFFYTGNESPVEEYVNNSKFCVHKADVTVGVDCR